MTKRVILILELTRNQAAALKRCANKMSYTEAMSMLYPHISADVRSEQVGDILSAFSQLEKALADSGVSAWPWIDSGHAGGGEPG